MEALRRSSPVPIDFKPIADNADGFFSLDDQSITIREAMSEIQTVSAVVHEIAHSKLHNNKKIEEPKNAPKYQEVEIFDVPGLFSNGRVSAADVPEGMFIYDLRGSDDDPGMPVAVENHVVVNHAGSVITAKPLDLGEEGRLMFTGDEGLNFVGGEISSYRFANEQRKDRNTEEVEAESISFAVCAYYGIATGDNSFGYIATWSKDKDLKELRESLETINKTSYYLLCSLEVLDEDNNLKRKADMFTKRNCQKKSIKHKRGLRKSMYSKRTSSIIQRPRMSMSHIESPVIPKNIWRSMSRISSSTRLQRRLLTNWA